MNNNNVSIEKCVRTSHVIINGEEAFASELLENIELMFPLHYTHSNVINILNHTLVCYPPREIRYLSMTSPKNNVFKLFKIVNRLLPYSLI